MSTVQGEEPITQSKETEAKARRLSDIANDLYAAVFILCCKHRQSFFLDAVQHCHLIPL